MAGIALARLQEERKLWKQNHPFVRTRAHARPRPHARAGDGLTRGERPHLGGGAGGAQGFVATPAKNADNTLNWLIWNCSIPGKPGVRAHPLPLGHTSRSCTRVLRPCPPLARSCVLHCPPVAAGPHIALLLPCPPLPRLVWLPDPDPLPPPTPRRRDWLADPVGARQLQADHDLLRGLPQQAAQVYVARTSRAWSSWPPTLTMRWARTLHRQVHAAALPPERLPVRHRLLIHPRRGRRVGGRHHHQAGAPSVIRRTAPPSAVSLGLTRTRPCAPPCDTHTRS